VLCCFVFGKKKSKEGVHPLLSPRPLKTQLHKVHEDFRPYPKKYFPLQLSISLREKECPFRYSHSFSEHEETGKLQLIVVVKCVTENTPERLFVRRYAHTHLFTIVSLSKIATADCDLKTTAVTRPIVRLDSLTLTSSVLGR